MRRIPLADMEPAMRRLNSAGCVMGFEDYSFFKDLSPFCLELAERLDALVSEMPREHGHGVTGWRKVFVRDSDGMPLFVFQLALRDEPLWDESDAFRRSLSSIKNGLLWCISAYDEETSKGRVVTEAELKVVVEARERTLNTGALLGLTTRLRNVIGKAG